MQLPYRQERGVWQIDLRLDRLQQLVSSMDPSPLPHRDLDPDAEHYILEAARELPSDEPWALALWLPAGDLDAASGERIERIVRHYFAWSADTAQRRLRAHLHNAWRSTLLGLSFMASCMLALNLLEPFEHVVAQTAAEGLLVIGWVALWRPLEMFLYDWWPLHREWRLMRRLSQLPVTLHLHASAEPAAARPGQPARP